MADGSEESPLALNRASQKITAAAILLRAMPEPSMPEGRNLCKEAQALLEDAAVQQAESSVSRIRSAALANAGGAAQQDREVSVYTPPAGRAKAPMVHDCVKLPPTMEPLRDTCGNAYDGDGRNILNQKKKDSAIHSYHPRRGGRYDSKEDRSPSPEPPGTHVFSREICAASFPPCFRQPTTLTKYSGETDPGLWLNDYRLACQLGGATDDAIIICNLPLHLADSARTWLEHLPASQIHDWSDLVRTFAGNFQGTYVQPGNSWDLRGCRQQPDEPLRDYI